MERAVRDKRVLSLDGVRGIAVLSVFLIHAGFWNYGWIGVSTFFVLSGFLITGILRRARSDYRFWGPFYWRRVTRILPALVVAYLCAVAICKIPWIHVGPYFFLFLANVGEWKYRGDSQTLGVLWSLAIEEQFYFIWPFAVRYLSRKYLVYLLYFIVFFEPIIRAIYTNKFSDFWGIFFLTPFQLDGLATGSLLAVLLESSSFVRIAARFSGAVFWCVLIVFCGLCCYGPFHREANTVVFNSLGYSLINLLSASLICYVSVCESSNVSRCLSKPSIVLLGTISYGIYLFHPVILLFVSRIAGWIGFKHLRALAPIAFLMTVGLSYISFNFYEYPITQWGRRQARKLYIQ